MCHSGGGGFSQERLTCNGGGGVYEKRERECVIVEEDYPKRGRRVMGVFAGRECYRSGGSR